VATLTVAGCAVLVVGMARADADRQAAAAKSAPSTPTIAAMSSIPAQLVTSTPAARATHARSTSSRPSVSTSPRSSAAATSSHSVPTTTAAKPTVTPQRTPTPTLAPKSTAAATRAAVHTTAATPTPTATHAAVRAVTAKRGQALPLHYSTGSATRVITVVAGSTSSTTAKLQVWRKAPGGGWLKSGRQVTAHVGSDGLSKTPSEYRSATPIGSFTLTQAFGRDSDPGTALPYFKTTPADWWISQAGPLYNTHQRCSSHCSFTQGDPNEHLYYETPYYNYAVVIDANTRNTGHVKPYGGSAFFLHVTDGQPTAGCVAIAQTKLVHIMRSLTPGKHPRILIGVA
jgi:L,D-peptidoglycan transpeptidase YkuD (ErfK/YbiS/YcfS/YnhG family)